MMHILTPRPQVLYHTARQVVLRVQSTQANIATATSYFELLPVVLLALVLLTFMPEGWHNG